LAVVVDLMLKQAADKGAESEEANWACVMIGVLPALLNQKFGRAAIAFSERCQRVRAGDILELLQGVVVETDRVRRRQAKSLTAEEVIDKAEKVAVEMKTGNLGRASKILVAAGRPPQDAAAKEVMIEKHPQAGLEAQIELRTKGTAALAGPPAGAAWQVAIEINTRELQHAGDAGEASQSHGCDVGRRRGWIAAQPYQANAAREGWEKKASSRHGAPLRGGVQRARIATSALVQTGEPIGCGRGENETDSSGGGPKEVVCRNLVLDKLAEAGCSAVEGRPARSWSIERGGVGELRRVVGSRDGVLDSSDRP
jgi:hypothetical protein